MFASSSLSPTAPSPASESSLVDPNELICKLVVEDGIPFSVLTKSTSIQTMFKATTGKCIPASGNTIRDTMLRQFSTTRENVIHQFKDLKTKGKKMSFTLDEWTSGANKRYMNLNVHIQGSFWNLGLSKIEGNFTSEACLALVKKKLEEFELNLKEDIFAISTDGASTMKRFGGLSGKKHQLCLAHGIHLAVVDVLYKKRTSPCSTEVSHASADDDEDDLDSLEPVLRDI